MLEAVGHVGRAVLDAVLVPVIRHPPTLPYSHLAAVVEVTGVGVEPLDDLLVSLLLSPSQIGPAMTEDVRGEYVREQLRPCVDLPTVLPHVGIHAGRDGLVDRTELVDLHTPAWP